MIWNKCAKFAIAGIVLASGSIASSASISDILQSIGGSPDINIVSTNSAVGQTYTMNASEILESRFFRQNRVQAYDINLKAALTVFQQQCVARGGEVVGSETPAGAALYARTFGRLSQPISPIWHWAGAVSICLVSSSHAISGIAAIEEDAGRVASKDEMQLNSRLMAHLFGVPVMTGVFVLDPDHLPTPAAIAQEQLVKIERQQQNMKLDAAYEQARAILIDRFRQHIAIGSETSCGTVIDMRGPLAQIQTRRGQISYQFPDGSGTTWIRVDHLLPQNEQSCLL